MGLGVGGGEMGDGGSSSDSGSILLAGSRWRSLTPQKFKDAEGACGEKEKKEKGVGIGTYMEWPFSSLPPVHGIGTCWNHHAPRLASVTPPPPMGWDGGGIGNGDGAWGAPNT